MRKGQVAISLGRCMDVLIVGSIAYDSVTSPHGSVENALGGSATYGGLACGFHTQRLPISSIGLVGVVGEDFSDADLSKLTGKGLDITGIEKVEGETFRWKGSYEGSMAEAQTHETHLNVFEHFQPKVPTTHQNPVVTFCANLHPMLQASVLAQAPPQRCSMLDSMNLWIDIAKEPLLSVMKQVDIVIINDGEVRMLADEDNLVLAAQKVLEMVDVSTLIVKRGEHGVIAFHGNDIITLPAYPTALVVDPTGCGDTFAGSLAAHLASGEGIISRNELRQGLVAATVSASFTLESFGTKALDSVSVQDFEKRLVEFEAMLQ